MTQKEERDFQYGYNQVMTALVADTVIFNSEFNKMSFLDNINSFFNMQPDCKPDTQGIRRKIETKSHVLHFPVRMPPYTTPPPTPSGFGLNFGALCTDKVPF